MQESVIDNQTEEKIKNYLSDEESGSMSDLDDGKYKKHFKSKKIILLFFVLIIISILSLFYYMRMKGKDSFDDSRVKIYIEVSQQIMSGEELAFDIRYKNDTDVNLKNAQIYFYVPKNFIYISSDQKNKREGSVVLWEIPNIPAGESSSIKLFGRVIGEKESIQKFQSKISYTPENFNYEFESKDELSDINVTINRIPFSLSVQKPEIVTIGDKFNYVIDYKNISNDNFKSINIRAAAPVGFACNTLDPNFIEQDKNGSLLFNIKGITPKTIGAILINCNIDETIEEDDDKILITLESSEDDKKFFEYIREETQIKLKKVPITIKQTINGMEEYATFKGDDLEYTIKFRNISDEEIKGLVINSELSGKIDFDSIEVVNGSYDKKSNKITWSAFNVPKLASFSAGDEGEVSFRVRVSDYIEIKNAQDKNFLINNIVTVSSFNFDSDLNSVENRIASNNNITKLNASLFVRSKGYFNDDGRIENVGAIPPEVGKKTNYLIHWNLSNLFNDISSVRTVAVLPEGINWTGNFITSDGKVSLGDENNGSFTPEEEEVIGNEQEVISGPKEVKENLGLPEVEKFYFNTKTREVVWEIPLLNANTGVISPVKEVVFQVNVIPNEDDLGKVLKILESVQATGHDNFTNKEIKTIDIELNSDLPDDYSIGINEGVVVANSIKAR